MFQVPGPGSLTSCSFWPARSRWLGKLTPSRWLAVVLALAAGALMFILGCLENRLIYYPSRDLLDAPSDHAIHYQDVWRETSDGIRIHGWILIPSSKPRAYLLFSHGNAGNISLRPEVAKPLVDRGFEVLLYDYRGYGKSQGSPTEQGTYLDGEAMLAYLLSRTSHPKQVFLFGESLGGGVSHELALRHPELGGIITSSTFTSMREMAAKIVAIPGVSLLVSTRYDNLAKAKRIALPRLILHGTNDELVPFEMAERLRDATRPPADFAPIQGAGHNDTYAVGGKEYYDEIERFIDKHCQ